MPLNANNHTESKPKSVPLDQIQVDGFLGRRIRANVQSLLAGLTSPIAEAFEAMADGRLPTTRGGSRLSDLFKWLEGASYAAINNPSADLTSELSRVVDLIRSALPTLKTYPAGYQNLYVAGHFFQQQSRITGSLAIPRCSTRPANGRITF